MFGVFFQILSVYHGYLTSRTSELHSFFRWLLSHHYTLGIVYKQRKKIQKHQVTRIFVCKKTSSLSYVFRRSSSFEQIQIKKFQ